MTLPEIANTLVNLQCDYHDLQKQVAAEALALETTIQTAQSMLGVRCRFLEVLAEKSQVLDSMLPKLLALVKQAKAEQQEADWWKEGPRD